MASRAILAPAIKLVVRTSSFAPMISTTVPEFPTLSSTSEIMKGPHVDDTVLRNRIRDARKIWSGVVDF